MSIVRTVSGKITKIFPIIVFENINKRKITFILLARENGYDTELAIDAMSNNAIDKLNEVGVGAEVSVDLLIGSKLGNGKYFTNLGAKEIY